MLLLFTNFQYRRNIKKSFQKLLYSKQRIIMPKKAEYVKFKNYERKIKSPFIIYADSENIFEQENNGKQNPEEFYTNKYQNHIACSYS